jgi:hypothetical protein
MEANYSSVPQVQHGNLVELAELGKAHLPVALTSAFVLMAAFVLQSMMFKGGPVAKIPLVGPKTIKARLLQFAGRGSWDMYRESYFNVRCNSVTTAVTDTNKAKTAQGDWLPALGQEEYVNPKSML